MVSELLLILLILLIELLELLELFNDVLRILPGECDESVTG